jgi:hypothetical protein
LCSVSHTAFLEKLICCISQSDGCSSDVQVDGELFEKLILWITFIDIPGNVVINQDIKEWCSWENYIKTPRQTKFRDSPQLPSACSSSVWCTSSPESEIARRSYYPSASDFNSGSSSNSSFSGKKVAGIVIVCMVVALGLAMGIITCGVRASRANSRPARVNPRPPPLPMHTARHSSTVQPRNSPQRPPTAIIRGGTPPPPPYSAKDEPTPHYESIRMAS